jgi:hypothetical protein
MRDFTNKTVLKLAERVLGYNPSFGFSIPHALKVLRQMATARKLYSGHVSAEWEYIEDARYIDIAQAQSMFNGSYGKLGSASRADNGDSPSPMFVNTLLRMQEMFWLENRRLPNHGELRELVAASEKANSAYLGKYICDLERNGWIAERDDILQWEQKRDVDYEYFEADEECEEPESTQGSSESESDYDEDDDEVESPTCPADEESLTALGIPVSKVNHILDWIDVVAVEEDADRGGISLTHVAINADEYFAQLPEDRFPKY